MSVLSLSLLLFNQQGKIYCIEELVEKPAIGKKSGDYSVPWETLEPGESDASGLKRVLEEEVWGNKPLEHGDPKYLGEIEVVLGAKARVYQMEVFEEGEDICRGSQAGLEYLPLGFCSIERLLSGPRVGIREMLSLLEEKKRKTE